MTAFELRRHLAAQHDLPLHGLTMGQLVKIHDQDHEAVPLDHVHDHDGEGDG